MATIEAISVLVPSRGRPESMTRLSDAFLSTCKDSTVLHWVIDANDPRLDDYRAAYTASEYRFQALWVCPIGPSGIVHPLNWVAKEIFQPKHGFYPSILGFMGDDHVPRTKDWDIEIERALAAMRTGIVYGDDKLQGARLPTAAFMTTDIIQALGYMAPPILRHLWVDNYWLELGQQADCLQYLPNVVFEHLHYSIGKSVQDETYTEVNGNAIANYDRQEYLKYKATGRLERDAALIRALKSL